MRILLDVDGVVCDFTEWWYRKARGALGAGSLSKVDGDPQAWELRERHNLNPKAAALVERAVYTSSPEDMLPILGAVQGVAQLADRGHDIHYVTTSFYPNPLWELGRRRWFERVFGRSDSKRLTFTAQKHICAGDIFVDDKPANVAEWQRHNGGRGVVFGAELGHPLLASSWEQLIELVDREAEHRPAAEQLLDRYDLEIGDPDRAGPLRAALVRLLRRLDG